MREIEEKIAAWVEGDGERGAINKSAARELEAHLYDAIDEGVAAGSDTEEAFESAVAQLGDPAELEKEFAKVYPEVSWVRRALWLAAGYALVGLVIKLSHWAYMLVEPLVLQFFPTSVFNLGRVVTIDSIEYNIFLAPFGRGDLTFDQLHAAVVAGYAARLGLLMLFSVWMVSMLRRRPEWCRKLLHNNRRLAIAVIATVGAQLVLSTHWAWGLWRQLSNLLGVENWATLLADGITDAERVAGTWWVSERMFWIEGVWLLGVAFCVLRMICRRRTEGGASGWLFGGYFIIAGLGHLLGLFGTGVALLAVALFPGLSQTMGQPSWLNPVFYIHTPAGFVNIVAQLVIFALLLGGLWVLFGRNRSIGIVERVRHRAGWLLALWVAVFVLPAAVLRAHAIPFPHSVLQVIAHTWVSKGIWIAALVVMATTVWGWCHRSDAQREKQVLA